MRKLKITELNRISAEEFKQVEKLPLVVVLDDIRSLHNIDRKSTRLNSSHSRKSRMPSSA